MPRRFQISLKTGEESKWCAVNPDGGHLALELRSPDTDLLRIVALDSGSTIEEFRPPEAPRMTVAMNGSALVTVASRALSRMRLSDRLTDSMSGRPEGITAVAISPTDSIAGTADGERNIRLWDLEPLAPRTPMPGRYARIKALAFSTDGRTLASADEDGVIKLWQVATGRQLFELPERMSDCEQLLFVSRPIRLLCRYRSGDVFVYRFKVTDLVDTVPSPEVTP